MENFVKSAAIGALVFFGVQTDMIRNLVSSNVHIVSRETHFTPNPRWKLGSPKSVSIGEYSYSVELQNTGRPGKAYFYVVQGDNKIMCRDQYFLNKGERRRFILKCPGVRDGTVNFILSGSKRHS